MEEGVLFQNVSKFYLPILHFTNLKLLTHNHATQQYTTKDKNKTNQDINVVRRNQNKMNTLMNN